ncbi:MAG: hypothetical protein GY856_07045 [bacterium]|nr:hypothetical protein [bacterium]
MLIHCTHCSRELNLADDKIPAGPFVLTCPVCKNRFTFDPTSRPAEPSPGPEPPAPAPPAAPEPPAAAEQPAAPEPPAAPEQAPASAGGFEPLPLLHPTDQRLLDSLYPAAVIVNLAPGATDAIEAGLRFLGMREIQHFEDLASGVEMIAESEVAILVIRLDKASAPPCQPLVALYRAPRDVRRRTFVVLVADNVRTLDGQVAFFLQVNCLINSQDLPQLPRHLRRGMLVHLRLYRHWGEEE